MIEIGEQAGSCFRRVHRQLNAYTPAAAVCPPGKAFVRATRSH